MSVIGTKGQDVLQSYSRNDFMAGLAGNDILHARLQGLKEFVGAFGGSGNDTYVAVKFSNMLIADSSGNDILELPFTASEFDSAIIEAGARHQVVDGQHYFFNYGGVACLIRDFSGQGKIEAFRLTDGTTYTFEEVWAKAEAQVQHLESMDDIGLFDSERIYSLLEHYTAMSALEDQYSHYDTPTWFDGEVYMDNKRQQTQDNGESYSPNSLREAFETVGYYGEDGQYIHFLQSGQWEEVSPVALFDANHYYTSKAAQFYNIRMDQVSEIQRQDMIEALHNSEMNAWMHYQMYGTREGVDASAEFNTNAYLQAKVQHMRQTDPVYTLEQLCDTLEQAGLSAIAHYYAYGKDEGISLVGVVQEGVVLAEEVSV